VRLFGWVPIAAIVNTPQLAALHAAPAAFRLFVPAILVRLPAPPFRIDGRRNWGQSNSMPPAPSSFDLAADELRRQEFTRMADAVPPSLEALRSLAPAPFRAEIALMLERLGYLVIAEASAHDLVVTKDGRKHIVACATPADPEPTRTRDLARLHDAVVAANAHSGFFVTTRGFTTEAEQYAETAPIKLVDGRQLVAAMKRSKARLAWPHAYKAMCRQCGEIVQHQLDQAEALPCGQGHLVAPTIARAALVRPKRAAPDQSDPTPTPSVQPLTRRQIRAHNHVVRGRALKRRREA
jgi:hypothetical protein